MNNTHATTHTPGPWTTFENTEGWSVTDEHNNHVAYCDYMLDEQETDAKANACLIAAAPDMLEALRVSQQFIDDIINAMGNGSAYTVEELTSGAFDKDYRVIVAAIAKAEGR